MYAGVKESYLRASAHTPPRAKVRLYASGSPVNCGREPVISSIAVITSTSAIVGKGTNVPVSIIEYPSKPSHATRTKRLNGLRSFAHTILKRAT